MQHLVSSQHKSLRHPNHEVSAAHPLLAGALCDTATAFADLFESPLLHLWAHRAFWALMAVAAIGLVWARSEALL